MWYLYALIGSTVLGLGLGFCIFQYENRQIYLAEQLESDYEAGFCLDCDASPCECHNN